MDHKEEEITIQKSSQDPFINKGTTPNNNSSLIIVKDYITNQILDFYIESDMDSKKKLLQKYIIKESA